MIEPGTLPPHLVGTGVGQYDPTTGIYNAGPLATVTVSASDDNLVSGGASWLEQYGLWLALGVVALVVVTRR
ncbi:MAG: hypothetical protein KF736_09925 [Acidobacteria bacterium]|nr:hypothetical protein [Acidobacteriota bacterium]MCW5949825.1 hypothetical protein [Pyrinomonadaceae bacterium]